MLLTHLSVFPQIVQDLIITGLHFYFSHVIGLQYSPLESLYAIIWVLFLHNEAIFNQEQIQLSCSIYHCLS